MITTRTVILLDPTAEEEPTGLPHQARLRTLEGMRVGLLDNNHPNVDVYLAEAERLLKEDYGVAEVIYLRKVNASARAAPSLLHELVTRADAIVHAVAD
jgi:hypothetical protein